MSAIRMNAASGAIGTEFGYRLHDSKIAALMNRWKTEPMPTSITSMTIG